MSDQSDGEKEQSQDSQRLAMLLEVTKTIGSELNMDVLLPLIAM